jgi:hypothetical protein
MVIIIIIKDKSSSRQPTFQRRPHSITIEKQ